MRHRVRHDQGAAVVLNHRSFADGARTVNDATYSRIISFLWGIADDVLRDLYVRGKYRDVILPMTVIRRLDAVMEGTKTAVLEMKAALDNINTTG